MLKKVNGFLQNPSKKSKVIAAVSMAMVVVAMFGTFAFATGAAGNGDMATIVNAILDIILDVFFYIGILLLAWSVGMLILAFKNEDADSKSRAMMLLVVSVALIGFPALLGVVLDGTGFTMT